MSKGSKDRGSPAKRRESALWCETCGYGKSACKCGSQFNRSKCEKLLIDNPIVRTLFKACGWEVGNAEQEEECD